MRNNAFVVFTALAVLLLGGCKSSTGPDEESLIGTWQAAKAEYVKAADAGVKVDIVAGGSAVTLELGATTFTFTVNDARVQQAVLTGDWEHSIDTLTLEPSGVSFNMVFDMALNGSTLTLSGGGTMFDFTGTGAFEDAVLNLILTKE